ncbi:MAG: sulfatase-like hydrolase/transferase [Planctomycetaceae bacterium]|nr:sulfatase-like hydrolase/transferase [Planctomycetaceae bacterium]
MRADDAKSATPGIPSTSGHQRVPPSNSAMALHLFVLFNFAVAQPVFDLLGGRMEFLRDLSIPAAAIYSLAFVMSFGLPMLIILSVRLAGAAGRRAQSITFSAILFLLMELLALPALKQTGFLSPTVVYFGSLLLASSGAWLYWNSQRFRSLLSLCALGLPVFPALFLAQYSLSNVKTYATTQKLPGGTPSPVVLIVFDEFCGSSLMTPGREIDAARFPNFAALSRDGQWFRNASSVHELTYHAVPAILSGRYSDGQMPPGLATRPQNLFSMLVGAGGYEYAAFEPVSRLAPDANVLDHSVGDFLTDRLPYFLSTLGRVYLHHLTPDQHTRCLPGVPRLWFGVRLETDIDPQAHRGTFRYQWSVHRSQQFRHFLETIDGAGGPTVHFLHILMPHVPWSYLPSGKRYTEDGAEWELLHLGDDGDRWGADDLHATHAQQRYLLQLMETDRLLGQLIDKLKSLEIYDETLLVVTADHGISFRPGQYRRNVTEGNRDEILSVPLFIKRPGETQPGINDRLVETVDIFPTIADVLGYRLTRDIDGWSVFDEHRSTRTSTKFGTQFTIVSSPVDRIVNSRVPHEIYRRFGSGDDPGALYRIGPVPELIGRNVTDFPQHDVPPLTLDVSRFGDEWPSAPDIMVPCWFEGRVRNHNPVDEDPVVLAVAVNGVIQAVTRTYRHAAALSQWEALVPESAFHDGRNDVQIYRVTGSNAAWTLSACIVQRVSAS